MAGGAGAAHLAGVVDTDVIAQGRLADALARARFDGGPAGQISWWGKR